MRPYYRILLMSSWALLILYVLIGSVAENALAHSVVEQRFLRAVTPEGWAFFTKSPREAETVAYRRKGDRWVTAVSPNAHPVHLFGVRRSARVAGIELSDLMRRMPRGHWTPATTEEREATVRRLRPLRLASRAERPAVCGMLLLESREPIPWAWSRAETVRMPARRALLEVQCD